MVLKFQVVPRPEKRRHGSHTNPRMVSGNTEPTSEHLNRHEKNRFIEHTTCCGSFMSFRSILSFLSHSATNIGLELTFSSRMAPTPRSQYHASPSDTPSPSRKPAIVNLVLPAAQHHLRYCYD